MSEIQQQNFYLQNQQDLTFKRRVAPNSTSRGENTPSISLRDEFISQKKKNGLVERLFDGLKNLVGLGNGSKKIQAKIAMAENGQISEEEARNEIAKYRDSQATSEQLFGDAISVGASATTFFGLRNWLNMQCKKAVLNEKTLEKLPISEPELLNSVLKIAKSKNKVTMMATGAAAMVGGLAKYWSLKFNRIGSDEFKINKKDYNQGSSYNKSLYKLDKHETKKARHGANFRNFVSGAINGAMLPLTLLGGAIIGVPAYFAGNTLNRYFIGNHEKKPKSLGGYFNNLKDNVGTQVLMTAAMAVPMVKKARFTSVLDKNLKTVTDKLLNANLAKSEYGGKTTYQELEEILLNSKDVQEIINNPKLPVNEQIEKLTKENIFAVKFKQISNDGEKLTTALKEDCPATRTIEQAQEFANKNLGEGYKLSKCLGVGTVAETYLATSPSGQEVCLKMLKEGITSEKILEDKAKFVDLIKGLKNKTAEEKEYLLKNIDDLADGILKEVDFKNEMEAAQQLEKYTKVAKVVKPIEVKNGIYVMEKADGISLKSLVELNCAKNYLHALQNNSAFSSMFKDSIKNSKLYKILETCETQEEKINAVEKYIKQIESRTPQFGNIDLTTNDMKNLISEYEQVLVEQFNSIEKDGKILHADIHPGNIFIDVNALRNVKASKLDFIQTQLMGKRKSNQIFTLIDTGNTVSLSPEQAMHAINLSSYIKRGNVPDIVEYVLNGANLGGRTKEEATKLVSDELKKAFFDTQTELETVTNENILTMTSNIMRKYGMTPSDTQLNLNKARKSANNSLEDLCGSMAYIGIRDLHNMTDLTKLLTDGALLFNQYKKMQSKQEQLNLLKLPLEQQLKHKNNPNMLAKNSEDYLTYKLKQSLIDEKSSL
jgi:predicted unusual protein kinase regulating ubiquinone biosynthesis (AarF/ABC1/UbiB family)